MTIGDGLLIFAAAFYLPPSRKWRLLSVGLLIGVVWPLIS